MNKKDGMKCIDMGAFAYAKKLHEAEESYCRLHIKERPEWMPKEVHEFFLKELLCMVKFVGIPKFDKESK